MIQNPADVAAWLDREGLPLGPFAESVRYVRTGNGTKLHLGSSCERVPKASRGTVQMVTLPVADIRSTDLCSVCCTLVPSPARGYHELCRDIAAAAQTAAQDYQDNSWAHVAYLDVARWNLRRGLGLVYAGAREVIAPFVEQAYQVLTVARDLAASRAPNDLLDVCAHIESLGLLEAGQDPAGLQVVALIQASYSALIHAHTGRPYNVTELLARLDVVFYAEGVSGYAVTPLAVAALLARDADRSHGELEAVNVGPANTGDDTELLRTAARLLSTLWMTVPEAEFRNAATDALTVARGIHHPSAP